MEGLRKWLDNSKISCLERCPREFYWRYYLHLTREKPSIAIAYGKAMHEVIEQALLEPNPQKALDKALALWKQELQKQLNELGLEVDLEDYRAEPSTGELALIHLFTDGACKDLYGLMEKVLSTELMFDTPIGVSEWTFRGRADIIILNKTDTISLIDIKTTGWKMESWAEKAIVDCQLHSYASALEKLGYNINSASYLVVQANRRRLSSGAWSNKPTLKSALFPVAVTESHKERMRDRMRKAAIRLDGRNNLFLWECVWSSCQRLSGICQFHPLCERFWQLNGDELRSSQDFVLETSLSLGYKQEEWNPFDL